MCRQGKWEQARDEANLILEHSFHLVQFADRMLKLEPR